MSFTIQRGDITRIACDAIVNAANSSLLGGGGVDGAIHAAAGRELYEECKSLGGCKVGEAKLTKGYRLPCNYIIHTVGPTWRGGTLGEEEALSSCYRECLRLARDNGCTSIAFPLISAGAYGYPMRRAIEVAEREILAFLENYELSVILVIYGRGEFPLPQGAKAEIEDYLKENYRIPQANYALFAKNATPKYDDHVWESAKVLSLDTDGEFSIDEVDALFESMDDGFSARLLRLIDERGWTDAQCYRRANIDRRLFSKIRSNPNYHPKKETVLAFALALQLPLEQTEQLLESAGYALSNSVKADVIISYYIERGVYDVFAVNEALFAYGQPLLGECRP